MKRDFLTRVWPERHFVTEDEFWRDEAGARNAAHYGGGNFGNGGRILTGAQGSISPLVPASGLVVLKLEA